jgi:tellurite resistance protein TerC
VNTSRPLFSLRVVKRIVITVIGGSVLTIGVALLVLPGPAFIVIPIGLALLATEYAWARRLLRTVEEYAVQLTSRKSQ